MEFEGENVNNRDTEPLMRKIDSLQLNVPDLDTALQFYRDELGHELAWRTDAAAGLKMPETDAEIVLQSERKDMEVDLLVDSADDAAVRFEEAGGKIVVHPFDIQIGRCTVVQDPWGNQFVLLDMSKGPLITDASGYVIANSDSGHARPM